MPVFNLNALHNILNVLLAICGSLIGFSWDTILTAGTGGKIIAGLSFAKLVLNGLRDGLGGMIQPQPPVKS